MNCRCREAFNHACLMKITHDVGIYAAEQSIAEDEALKRGMKAKPKEVWVKAPRFTRRFELVTVSTSL